MSDTETNSTEEPKRRGRPSLAELDAREAALKQREEEIALREREVELAAAEATADARAAQLERAESTLAAGRSGSARSDTIRSETVTQPLRRRRYHSGEMPNEFHIPEDQIPVGTSYQWNNYTVFGKDNPSYDAHMQMQGWVPVLAERHPHLMPKGYQGPIIVKGQILMERPIELTQEALQEDYDRAVGEVRAKEVQLYGAPEGTMQRSRANGSNEFIQVNKEMVRGTPTKPNYQYEKPGGMPIE